MKEHICEMKQLILKDHVKVRQAYLDEGARKACIAEFNDVAKSIVGEVNKSFLALVRILLWVFWRPFYEFSMLFIQQRV